MGKALIIAEKPSVARDIAKALGGFKAHDEYFESEKYVLSSAIGHLLELAVPEEYEVKKGKWSFAHLPVIPPHFDLKPLEKSAARLRLLERLIKRKDVDCLINACDAGREGELIFRYLVKYTGTQKPIRRLWLQSMTPAAIREGFAQLREDAELQPLANAAICRSESDWLVGINGTRALTAFNSRSGGFQKTTVGRVQTPTLAILVEREQKIRKFVPRDYWEVHATFTAAAGTYAGRWFDEKFSRDKEDGDLRAERLWEAQRAEEIRARCLGKPGTVTEESKPATQLSPLLYDLTSLQREANSRFGFSAKATLSLAQALYEKHKVITYPRTDSRALPEDYPASVRQTLNAMKNTAYEPLAKTILENDWVRPNKRIFNNAKVSDHFAIIPTPLAPRHLTDAESKIYDMIARRFLAVFYPAAEYLVTTRITRVEGEPFKSEGKVMIHPGWLAVYGKEAPADEAPSLAPVQPGEQVDTTEIAVEKFQTRPPPRFTEATLLTAMEGAGKLVEDEELREAMAAKGLGTPATRAAIIEGLLEEKYIVRQGKELVPTAKAFSLIVLLNGLGIPELCKPEMTGDWEFKLKLMERGQLRREDFMREIEAMTRHIVEQARNYESDTVPGDFGELRTPCPRCGGLVKENYRNFQCQSCSFSFRKIVAGRILEHEEAEELLAKKVVGPLQGFRSQKGFLFSATLRMQEDGQIELDFGNGERKNGAGNGEQAEADVPPDFSHQEPLGTCPKCGARVFAAGMSYLCEKAAGAGKSCDFRVGGVILQRRIEPAELRQLLQEGRTGLLKGFVSKRNHRAFEAHLVLGKDGTVGFEFAPRARRTDEKEKNPAPPPKLDFTGQTPLGKCPRCGSKVFEAPEAYVCERIQAAQRACKFKVNKVILKQTLDREQITKLLTNRRTDVLSGFVSQKTGKPFKAALVLDEKEKVGFEFPERPPEARGT